MPGYLGQRHAQRKYLLLVFVTSYYQVLLYYALVVDQYHSDGLRLIVKMEKKERSEVIKENMN